MNGATTTKKMRGGPAARQAARAKLENEARAILVRIGHEVSELAPMGTTSAFMAGFARPRRGVVHSTPVGHFVFAKSRQPSREQLDRWAADAKRADQMQQNAVHFSWGLWARPGTTVGNTVVVERGRELQAAGLLSASEIRLLDRLAEFWEQNPDADTGVWEDDGSLRRLDF